VGDAAYRALSPICPHLGYLVDADARTGGFLCPGHHAAFTSLGAWTSGQVTTDLKVLASTFDAARGVVRITIP
jgi:Rieske Fe-S protein